MTFHPLLAIVVTLIGIQALLFWASWHRKMHYKWDDCPMCGAMVEMHREVTSDDEPIWKGSCDVCYNHVTQFTDYNG